MILIFHRPIFLHFFIFVWNTQFTGTNHRSQTSLNFLNLNDIAIVLIHVFNIFLSNMSEIFILYFEAHFADL